MAKSRIGEIYKLLEERKSITTDELSEIFKISASTIRRDLSIMEEKHMVDRFYGGVRISEYQSKEPSLLVKNFYNNDCKKAIARFAASMVKDGDVVYIDGGTTTSEIISFIGRKDILIVTQAFNLFEKIADLKAKCLILTGYLKKNTQMIISKETIEQVSNINFDIAFIGGNSVHAVFGYSAADDMEAVLKSAVIQHSKKTYVLADSTKFKKLTSPQFAKLEQCNVITDELVDGFDYSRIPEVYYFEKGDYITGRLFKSKDSH